MRDVEEGEFSVRNGVRKLRSVMKVGSFCTKVDVSLQFYSATTGDFDYIVDVSLVK